MSSFTFLTIIAITIAAGFIAYSVRVYNQVSRGERKLRHTRSESTTGTSGGWFDGGGGGDGGCSGGDGGGSC